MAQAERSAKALLSRFAGVYDETPRDRVMPPLPHGKAWPGHGFGSGIGDVKTIVVHETSGWPVRNRVEEFIARYTVPGHEFRGIGPQFFVSGDGTVMRLIDLPRITGHATFLNQQTLGIENGHRDNRAGIANGQGVLIERWRPLSTSAEDAMGRKLFALDHRFENPHEVAFAWFPTAHFAGPKGAAQLGDLMLFSEANYRSLAALLRWLAEAFVVPRSFPLYPWATREGQFDDPRDHKAEARFRGIVLADENYQAILDQLAGQHIADADFQPGNEAALGDHYQAAIVDADSLPGYAPFHLDHNNKRLNAAWLNLFKALRGIHGHGFAGAVHNGHDDHTTCPGPAFDWHRLAREVWDWWWYPFDFDVGFTTTTGFMRDYLNAGVDTPLIEYFFENAPSDPGVADPYIARTYPPGGIQADGGSPNTFRTDRGSPIYAMANGQLVAARMLTSGAGVDMSFALVRHEVYHQPSLIGRLALLEPLLPLGAVANLDQPGRIDYDAEPTVVYSLYMHLAGQDDFVFDEPAPSNPDWLNRVLIRKRECDLAYDAQGNLNPVLAAINPNEFSRPPPWYRPTSLELLRLDRDRIATFLDDLSHGRVAIAPLRAAWELAGPTPTNVVLGDYLGVAGKIRVENGVTTTGIRVEVFSPALIELNYFTEVPDQPSWNVPVGVSHPAIPYVSEWKSKPTGAAAAALRAIGVDPDLVPWWDTVADAQRFAFPVDGKLPHDGRVYHYWPLDVVKWINGVTWASEWSKYRVNDADGDAPLPPRPRKRRV